MRRLALILTLCAGCCLAAVAQTTFTDQLQQSKAGEGKVTVTQDKSIEQLVNTPPAPAKPRANGQSSTDMGTNGQTAATSSKDPSVSDYDALTPDTTSFDLRKKVMKGQKANGFRVQVFAGGNSRNDRMKAERTGEEIKAQFPAEPVYVHFYSPRWICRMGNYATQAEAQEALAEVRRMGFPSATIVRARVKVAY